MTANEIRTRLQDTATLQYISEVFKSPITLIERVSVDLCAETDQSLNMLEKQYMTIDRIIAAYAKENRTRYQ